MKAVLKKFITEPLFDASAAMLEHLQIQFTPQSRTPLAFTDLYPTQLPQALAQVVDKVEHIYLIGAIDEESLAGRQSDFDIEKPLEGKYATMLVFAVDMKSGANLTRTELATLTRGFNRMAPQLPVILFVKNGYKLTLATCERSEYKQEWRSGEKLGKVSILRDIDCNSPHRGHLDILDSLGDKAYPTFDELYDHWFEVFSSKLLTKKFYTELSEWYAWVIGSGKVKFPNDLTTTDDDAKYNHEAVIRLITRLIFVWFLKQKNLIPEEFFDERFIREHFIENFDPHSTNTLFYDPSESKYYRLILQNLFFAMLNRPIKDEESGNEENRRFATSKRYHGISPDYNINNLLRYRSEFASGGAELLLSIANSRVPFLNGGLFECLDDKENKLYYDGFSEHPASLDQLSFPDYFFFGEEVGSDIDLSAWYDDKQKKHVCVRGLINILKNYHFTVEENTPLDQEVSLDPELLGKVFENLLASYNPETNTTARKQTGSFYTPREIVQYMVDESLIAHLRRHCPEINEKVFRNLFDYSLDNFEAPESERRSIMKALYNCKVLDPACGSGALGILQQMVHALRKLDPSNEMWREFILDISLKKDREAYQVENEQERTRLRVDIEQSFNHNINDPDYARKLYLIENCIYGVDIQPIATQISKLRFFISLVAEQKPTSDASGNFGIRPLPNLEAKIVAANSLIPLGEGNIFTNTEEISNIKKRLANANHKLFIAKRNAEKRKIREQIVSIRKEYADELVLLGAVDDNDAMKLAKWNMFDQNEFAKFFDPQWMFGISDGFDIIIGNPPYVLIPKSDYIATYSAFYKYQEGKIDLYRLFIERAVSLLNGSGVLSFITPNTWLTIKSCAILRRFIIKECGIAFIDDYDEFLFSASVNNVVFLLLRNNPTKSFMVNLHNHRDIRHYSIDISDILSRSDCEINVNADDQALEIRRKMLSNSTSLGLIDGIKMCLGVQPYHNSIHTKQQMKDKFLHADYQINNNYIPEYGGKHFSQFSNLIASKKWVDYSAEFYTKPDKRFFIGPRIVVREIPAKTLICAYIEEFAVFNKSVFNILSSYLPTKFLIAILNSKAVGYFISAFGDKSKQTLFPRISMKILKTIPIPNHTKTELTILSDLVDKAIEYSDKDSERFQEQIEIINLIVYHLYGLNYDEVLIIDPETPITREDYDNFNIEEICRD